jgi:hypothetical protein
MENIIISLSTAKPDSSSHLIALYDNLLEYAEQSADDHSLYLSCNHSGVASLATVLLRDINSNVVGVVVACMKVISWLSSCLWCRRNEEGWMQRSIELLSPFRNVIRLSLVHLRSENEGLVMFGLFLLARQQLPSGLLFENSESQLELYYSIQTLCIKYDTTRALCGVDSMTPVQQKSFILCLDAMARIQLQQLGYSRQQLATLTTSDSDISIRLLKFANEVIVSLKLAELTKSTSGGRTAVSDTGMNPTHNIFAAVMRYLVVASMSIVFSGDSDPDARTVFAVVAIGQLFTSTKAVASCLRYRSYLVCTLRMGPYTYSLSEILKYCHVFSLSVIKGEL